MPSVESCNVPTVLFDPQLVGKSVTLDPDFTSGSEAPPPRLFTLHCPARRPTATPQVLLFLHGYPQNHTLWYEVVNKLLDSGAADEYDIVVPDLPG